MLLGHLHRHLRRLPANGVRLLSSSSSSSSNSSTTASASVLVQSPLKEVHERASGKMVDFAGWSLPVQYPSGVLQETLQTRRSASLFDVSHMQQINIVGDSAADFLESVCVGSIKDLKPGQGQYTLLTNENGGIIDDACVSRHDENEFLIVCNADCAQKDIAHLEDHAELFGNVQCCEIEDKALVALQGPEASSVLSRLVDASEVDTVSTLGFFHHAVLNVAGIPCWVARCGYTGEDGFEISVAAERSVALVDALLDHSEVALAGLGARDALRLEAGLCLYGHDLDDSTSPVEAGLAWTIGKRRRREGGFLGAEAVLLQLKEGTSRHRVGLLVSGAPARENVEIVDLDGKSVGAVTSGAYSPTLKRPIAMGYVNTGVGEKVGDQLQVMVRGRATNAEVTSLPFVPSRYYRPSKAKKE